MTKKTADRSKRFFSDEGDDDFQFIGKKISVNRRKLDQIKQTVFPAGTPCPAGFKLDRPFTANGVKQVFSRDDDQNLILTRFPK